MSIVSTISSFALPPWLKPKFVLCWGVGILVIGLSLGFYSRGQQIQTLTTWQTGVIQAVSDTGEPDSHGVKPTIKADQVVQAITGLNTSFTSAKTALKTINAQTVVSKAKADTQDAQLRTDLAKLTTQFDVAHSQILELKNRPAVAPAKICPTIEQDTNSAWDGWLSPVAGVPGS